MAQGTAMQALARGAQRLNDPALPRGRRARARAPSSAARRRACASPQGADDWYALYSFAPQLNVLNGMLQAVNGMRTYAEYRRRPDGAASCFEAGDRTARRSIASYDTGAWSLYNRPGGQPGPEANLNYHTLNRDFARNLCKGDQGRAAYCKAADHFTQYLKEDPTLDPHGAVPSPARAGKGVRFRFKLSKIGARRASSCAPSGKTYLVARARRSRTASATSAGCRRARAASAPTPSRCSRATSRATRPRRQGDVRVKLRAKRPHRLSAPASA